ncbi:hypothetical protein MKZ38_006923 [Zalerion maritima]|uniref:Clr5 domain-containing protein n=1 Tax=Zalerion maritima TaxID=339359 RepID=A0AAD5WWN5_9PEZI|nr:hypothetical protein MKZ38_006923 [Zalerion maritima]
MDLLISVRDQPVAAGDGRKRKAKAGTLKEDSWPEPVKKRIKLLHKTKTLPEIMQDVEEHESFTATERQFKSIIKKLGLKKHISGDEMRYMAIVRHQTRQLGQTVQFCVRDEMVDDAKIDRWISRSEFTVDAGGPQPEAIPEGITYSISSRDGQVVMSIAAPPLPAVPQEAAFPSSISSSFVPEGSLILPHLFEDVSDTTASFLSGCGQPRRPHPPSPFGYSINAPSHQFHEASLELLATFPNCGQLLAEDDPPRPPSVSISFPFDRPHSPISINWGFYPHYHPLPWYQLESNPNLEDSFSPNSSPRISPMMDFPDLSNRRIQDLPRQAVTGDLASRHGILAALTGRSKPLIGTEVAELSNTLPQLIPERHPGDLKTSIETAAHSSTKRALLHFFKLAAYFISNALGSDEAVKSLLQWVTVEGHLNSFLAFAQVDLPITRTFSRRVVRAAESLRSQALIEALLSSGIDLQLVYESLNTQQGFKSLLGWARNESRLSQLVVIIRSEDQKRTEEEENMMVKAAVETEDLQIIQALLADTKLRKLVLNEAISTLTSTEISQQLLGTVDPELIAGGLGSDLLITCASSNKVALAKQIVSLGANVNQISFNYQRPEIKTPLSAAVEKSHCDIAEVFLKENARVNEYVGVLNVQRTPIVVAISQENMQLTNLLLDYGADIYLPFRSSGPRRLSILDWASTRFPLMCDKIRQKLDIPNTVVTVADVVRAASNGAETISRLTNVSDSLLEEALFHSAADDSEAVETSLALLEYGVNPNFSIDGATPLQNVFVRLEDSAAWILVKHLAEAGTNLNVSDLLLRAVHYEMYETLQVILDIEANVGVYGVRALEESILTGQTREALLLLSYGTPINLPGIALSPIQAAAKTNNIELVGYLIDQSADINVPAKSHEGRTALQAACLAGHVDMVQFLLEQGAQPNAPPATTGGITASEGVCISSVNEEAKLLMLHALTAYDVHIPPRDPHTSHAANSLVRKAQLKPLKILLDAGVDVNYNPRGKEGRTLVQCASEQGSFEAVRLTLSYGGDVNASPAPDYGRTALQAAASLSYPNAEVIKHLLDMGANVNAPAGVIGGITAIQGAAIAGYVPVAELLLEHGADVNGRPAVQNGRYAIEGAAEYGRLDMVQLLLNHGAGGDMLRKNGFQRAIELAREHRHSEILGLLEGEQKTFEAVRSLSI